MAFGTSCSNTCAGERRRAAAGVSARCIHTPSCPALRLSAGTASPELLLPAPLRASCPRQLASSAARQLCGLHSTAAQPH